LILLCSNILLLMPGVIIQLFLCVMKIIDNVIKTLHRMHEVIKSRLNSGLSGDISSETFTSCCLLPENNNDSNINYYSFSLLFHTDIKHWSRTLREEHMLWVFMRIRFWWICLGLRGRKLWDDWESWTLKSFMICTSC
jgi:hypothetical protein